VSCLLHVHTLITRETVPHVHAPSYFSWPTIPCTYRRKWLSDWYNIPHVHDDKHNAKYALSLKRTRYLVRIKSDTIHAGHAFYYESLNRTAKTYKCIYQIN
jgi:hypothetical protein